MTHRLPFPGRSKSKTGQGKRKLTLLKASTMSGGTYMTNSKRLPRFARNDNPYHTPLNKERHCEEPLSFCHCEERQRRGNPTPSVIARSPFLSSQGAFLLCLCEESFHGRATWQSIDINIFSEILLIPKGRAGKWSYILPFGIKN